MHVPYALQLAQGDTRVPLTINVALLVVVLPLAWILVEQRAAVGAALSWLIFQVLYLLIGSWITHRRFLQGSYWRSLTHDVAVPALIAASFGVAVMYWCDSAQLGSSGQLLAGVTAMASAVAVGLASSPTLRAVARARIEMLRSHR
jgi:O-antigen/teichoic acid export membrane protein